MASEHTATEELAQLKELLVSVSRSFSITLNALPKRLRHPLSIAYLLARISDTLADAPQVETEAKIQALDQFSQFTHSDKTSAPTQELIILINNEYLPTHDHQGEKALLNRIDAVYTAYNNLPQEQKTITRTTLQTIIKGQRLDLERFGDTQELRALSTLEDLDAYTYQVAGCVGEYWTKIGVIVDAKFLTPKVDQTAQEQLGINYGKGLQLLNIYRDFGEDLANGRCYLPREVLAQNNQNSLALDNLLENPTQLRSAWAPFLQQCKDYLQDGLTYSTQLQSARCRYATGIPAIIGLHTIKALETSTDQQWLSGVKIDRSTVKKILTTTLVSSVTKNGILNQAKKILS